MAIKYKPFIEPGTPRERRERFVRRNFLLCAQAFTGCCPEAQRELVHAARLKQLYSEYTVKAYILQSLERFYHQVYPEEYEKNQQPDQPFKLTQLREKGLL